MMIKNSIKRKGKEEFYKEVIEFNGKEYQLKHLENNNLREIE